MHELAIEARALTKRFGKVVALDALDLGVERGESMAILGDAGAGKSTAMRLIAGLALPSGGSITTLGFPPSSRAGLAARARLGTLGQQPGSPEWMTARELLAFTAALLGLPRADVEQRIARTLDHVGLGALADRTFEASSLSSRQRLGFGQAILGDPEVLLLDEPLGRLDAVGRGEILDRIRGLRGGTTMVIATSDMELAETASDRVAVLDSGHLLACAPTAELLDRHVPRDYVLEVAVGSGLALAGLVARLSAEPWVREVIPSDGSVRVAVRDGARAEHELLPAVVGPGLTVLALRRERPGLEHLLKRLREAA